MVVKILGVFLLLTAFAIWLHDPTGSFFVVVGLLLLGFHLITRNMKSKWAISLWGLLITAATFGMRYLFLLRRP